MKLSKNLLSSMAVGLTFGTCVSCSESSETIPTTDSPSNLQTELPVSDSLKQRNRFSIRELFRKIYDSADFENCPACGMG